MTRKRTHRSRASSTDGEQRSHARQFSGRPRRAGHRAGARLRDRHRDRRADSAVEADAARLGVWLPDRLHAADGPHDGARLAAADAASASGATTSRSAWAFDIINFVWWIGIGHAGTLISAILLLFKQQWRMSISRFAEAMTIFAVMCAAIFPIFHTGRPWLAAYWLFPYPEHDGPLAAVQKPADLGRVRGHDLRHGFGGVLVCRPDSRPGDDAGSGGVEGQAGGLRRSVARLARLGASLAPLRSRVADSRRSLDAAGALGPHGRQLRLRGFGVAGLARDDLPAVLRRRRHLFRLRDGALAGDSDSRGLQAAGFHHHAAHRQHGQGHAGDGLDGGLRLHDGGVLRVVQRKLLRARHDVEPHVRPVRVVLLDAHRRSTSA